jgi:hypothetical protein
MGFFYHDISLKTLSHSGSGSSMFNSSRNGISPVM